MHVDGTLIAELEARYGQPEALTLTQPIGRDELAPIDTDEIAEARWVALDELQGPIRKVLLGTGRGLFAYRVALTDATVAALRSK